MFLMSCTMGDYVGRLMTQETSGFPCRHDHPYDEAGNRTSLTDPEAGNTSYVYDSLNRLTTLTNFQSQQFTFSYDGLSRRTQMTRPNGGNNGQITGIIDTTGTQEAGRTVNYTGAYPERSRRDRYGNRKNQNVTQSSSSPPLC